MTAGAAAPTDPGATPSGARALAPDLARGGMLLLIALANVHLYLYGHPVGVRGYPRDLSGLDRVVAVMQMVLVDGRAYPLFGLLFGYGIVQLAWRRAAVGLPARVVTRLVRRRGWWMLAIGFAHGALLWSGDIVGAYGLLAVFMAGLLVAGTDRGLLTVAGVGVLLTALLGLGSGLMLPGDPQAFLPSVASANPVEALLTRLVEWPLIGLFGQMIAVFGAVAVGAWAARRRLLDEPNRHRRLLARVAVAGSLAAVIGGLPLALMAGQVWDEPPLAAVLLAGSLHGLGGYAGGLGYAALFGLLAVRLSRRRSPGPLAGALRDCGQRSLSCYLAQSVVFVTLLPAWTLGLGGGFSLWQATLVGAGAWTLILLVAAWSARRGHPGPAEVLLRRLTYGRRPLSVSGSGGGR